MLVEPPQVEGRPRYAPPPDFRLLRSEIIEAWFLERAPSVQTELQNYSTCQKAGLRYERRVQKHLRELYGRAYTGAPWVGYREAHEPAKARYCQPDGLLYTGPFQRVTIIEIKNSHAQRAWWQLRKLYAPIIAKLHPQFCIHVCEVTRFYDRMIPFNEDVELVRDIAQDTPRFKVHILKP